MHSYLNKQGWHVKLEETSQRTDMKTAKTNLNKAHGIFTGEKAAKNDGIFGIKIGDKFTRHSTQLM